MTTSNTTHSDSDCPSMMALASFLDGRASAGEMQAIEAHARVCEACQAAVQDFHEVHAESNPTMVFVPAHVAARAMALLPPAHAVALHQKRTMVLTRRAAAIAAASTIGSVMGWGGYHIGAEISHSAATTAMNSQTAGRDDNGYTFELFDAATDDSFAADLFAFLNEEASS